MGSEFPYYSDAPAFFKVKEALFSKWKSNLQDYVLLVVSLFFGNFVTLFIPLIWKI